MFDKIEKKVHDIRREPEHIRMRYMWGALALSMAVIIFIWIMSMKTNFLQIQNDPDMHQSLDTLQEQIDTIKAPAQEEPVSIDDLLENPTKTQPEL